MSFEQSINRLEEIVEALDGDELELARALELFQEGIEQLRLAGAELERADAQVRRLVEQADGSFVLLDHDD
ncbi:MAG: exodeoxyribonuclease VII small subunit [Gemmatimonadaceae bacterium]